MDRTRTMIMFKPDCLEPASPFSFREILGEVIRLGAGRAGSDSGWLLEFGVRARISQQMAERLYAAHQGKPFYDRLVRFTSSDAPAFVSVWSCVGTAWETGRSVVSQIRQACGKSNPDMTGPANLIHGSGSFAEAEDEVRWATGLLIQAVGSVVPAEKGG